MGSPVVPRIGRRLDWGFSDASFWLATDSSSESEETEEEWEKTESLSDEKSES